MANFLFPFIFGTFILFFLIFLANFIIFKNLQINKKTSHESESNHRSIYTVFAAFKSTAITICCCFKTNLL